MRYVVALDLEATINNGTDKRDFQIIQLAAVLLDTEKGTALSRFNEYCQPIGEQRVLEQRIIAMTGITQGMVDSASQFPQVLARFGRWLMDTGFLKQDGSREAGCIMAADTKGFQLPSVSQCVNISGIRYSDYAQEVLTIGPLFNPHYWGLPSNDPSGSIAKWLDHLNASFQGNQHDGRDDAYNAARIIQYMVGGRVNLRATHKIYPAYAKPPTTRGGISRTCETELLV